MKIKRLLTGIATIGLAIALLPVFAAFEAHVINVTASISNALQADVYSIDFGTVFPQEKFDKQFSIGMSNSFQADTSYDDVEYVLRQKPKCRINSTGLEVQPTLPEFGQVTEDEFGVFHCQDEVNYDILPFLCPYLSKAEITTDPGASGGENDMKDLGADIPGWVGPLASFHGPILLEPTEGIGWDMNTTLFYQLQGRLAKSDQDISDTWNIDLKVPCFSGNHCAQDWADFVAANDGNNDANPNDYIQPIENEHQIFGCDLWVEVTGLSKTQETATLTVNKVLVTNDGGNEQIANFQLFVGATAVANGVPNIVAPGAYFVTEIGVSGYQATFSGDCNAAGQITLAAGENKQCTITNNDIAPNITLIKNVTNNNNGTLQPFQFLLRVDGNVVPQNTSVPVTANSPHAITEDAQAGYNFVSITGSAKCPAVLGGTATLDEGEAITCTINNDDI